MVKNKLLSRLNSRSGVTLIELTMLIVVVGILAASMSLYVKETIDLWNFVTFRNEVASQGRTALMRILRDIRHASTISTADTSALAFTDIDGNSISYTLNGTNLERGSQILASNVTQFTLAYYDSSNAQLTTLPLSSSDRGAVYRITVQLRIVYGGEGLTLNGEAYLRNF
jgi:type II secretory pathway pseudopilin PulG